jgi:hypothetical protein
MKSDLVPKRKTLILLVVLVCAAIGALVSLATNILVGAATGALLLAAFLKNAVQEISWDPPQKGALLLLGEFVKGEKPLDSGLAVLPFYPALYDFIGIETADNILPLTVEVRTPKDNIRTSIPVTIIWRANPADSDKAWAFISARKKTGVEDRLRVTVPERLRIWAESETEGPMTWEEVAKAGDDVVALLLKAIAGSSLSPINGPEGATTNELLHYYATPRQKPAAAEEKKWGKNWDKLTAKLKEPKFQDLGAIVEARREAVRDIRNGKSFPENSLGIELMGLRLGEIKEPKGISEQAAKQAEEVIAIKTREKKEASERKLEGLKVGRLKENMEKFPGLPETERRKAVQVELGRIKEEVKTFHLGVESDTLQAAGRVLTGLTGPFMKKSEAPNG